MSETPGNEFERAAAEESGGNMVAELWGFLKANKKWWLLPIVVALVLLGALLLLPPALAPFIYPLF